MMRLLLVISCLCEPCLASPNEKPQEVSVQSDNWYLVGCVVCSWEGLKTLYPGMQVQFPQPPVARVNHIQYQMSALPFRSKKEVVSVGFQTEGSEDPQLDELSRNRTQQARTIHALQGLIDKKKHDLQAIRTWRPTANAVGTIYLCPGGTVWHASATCP